MVKYGVYSIQGGGGGGRRGVTPTVITSCPVDQLYQRSSEDLVTVRITAPPW